MPSPNNHMVVDMGYTCNGFSQLESKSCTNRDQIELLDEKPDLYIYIYGIERDIYVYI